MDFSQQVHAVLQQLLQSTQNTEFIQQNNELFANLIEQWEHFQPANSDNSSEVCLQTEATLMTENTTHSVNEPTMPIQKPANLTPPPSAQSAFKPQNLPNAHQGKPYEVLLAYPIEHFQCQPECGLIWDRDNQKISGIPTISGEISMTYFTNVQGNFEHIKQTLYINPDPRSLWKNLPSDENALFYKPDSLQYELSTPYTHLLAARVRGRSHAHVGSFCDDDFFIHYFATGDVHLLCVSDGAGSAEFSRYGSQLAVNAVAQKIQELLNDTGKTYHRLAEMNDDDRQTTVKSLIANAAVFAYTTHYQAAQKHHISLKSLSCTLLIALTLPLSDGKWFTVAYWVGDGAIAIYEPNESQVILLGESDSGSYSGETRFLSKIDVDGDNLQQRIRSHISDTVPIVMLMTDGVSDPKFETEAQLNQVDKWTALWQELQEPLQTVDKKAALHEWLQFWSPGNHDDRTLAILQPKYFQAA